jgi:hypothetical protein
MVPTPSFIGDADAVESILDALHEDVSTPEFWSWQVHDGLAHLMRAIRSSERDGQETLLLEIRDVLEQLWWADWPAISSALEQEIRSLLARLRESEQRRVLVE